MIDPFSLALIIIILIVLLLYYSLEKKFHTLDFAYKQILHKKRSDNVRYGQTWEQFVPFMSNFDYNKENFKFLGKPIDGIVFGDSKITFIEVKTGNSQLSEKQRSIQELIEQNQVEFKVLRY